MERIRSCGYAGIFVAALTAVLVAGALLGSGSSGPASASETSPTPGTAPRGSAIVTVRYTLDGVPLATNVGRLPFATVDGHECFRAVFFDIFETIVQMVFWPWSDDPPCNATGVPVRMCQSSRATLCTQEFIFEGEDVMVDMERDDHPPGLSDYPAVMVNFGHDGVAQPVTLLWWHFGSPSVDCGVGGVEFPATVSSFVRVWPTVPREECKTLGLDLTATFDTEEFGVLQASFQWQGEDVTLEIDTGSLLSTPTPTPTPAPTGAPTAGPTPTGTPGPVSLPEAGGPPPGGGTSMRALGLTFLGVLVAVTVTVFLARRRIDIAR